ncbi:MAG: FAD:protein FMN transferase [Rhodocyclaceae bacterium]|nr:FAD:protein FMN transferase [Rhodocyclaceae bacterium]
MRRVRNSFALLLTLSLVLTLAACGRQEPWRREAYVFGTRVEILVQRSDGIDEKNANAAMAEVLQEFERLHRSYHAWQPSELSLLNTAIAEDRPLQVSVELAALITEAQKIAASGDYLFDPGIGKMVALWGFQSDEIVARLPDPAQINSLLTQHPSIANLSIKNGIVSSSNRAVALDFGGYLKGVALDIAASKLRVRGVRHALINIGGNVMALGNRDGVEGGKAWRVGIQHPRAEQHGGLPLASLDLRDGEAIGTSGDYHRFFELNGQRYCHLIDPRTGRPTVGTQSVTIVIPPGPNAGMRSDALSKPIFIAADKWYEMGQRLGVDAVLRVGADNTLSTTAAMNSRLTIEVPDLKVGVRK